MPDRELLSYMGGIMDGEGCIIISRFKRDRGQNRERYNYTIRVAVSMCDKEIPQLFYDTFGGGIYCRNRNSEYKPVYDWVVTGRIAKEFLILIQPYLRIDRKIESSKLCIELQNNIENKITQQRRIDNATLEIRENLYQQCKLLNKRGVN